MEDPDNNGTTVSFNKPINLFISKRIWLLWYELSIKNLYKLSTFGCSYVFYLKQFNLVSLAKEFTEIIIKLQS